MKQEVYIKLLLEGCLKLERGMPLFVSCSIVNHSFIEKLVAYADDLGIEDIYIDEKNPYVIHDTLKSLSIREIKHHPLFDNSIWDEYAKKGSAFLMLESEIPGLMDDVESEKIATSVSQRLKTKPLFRKRQLNNEIPWCIAVVPNATWAKEVFGRSDDSYGKLWETLINICMLNRKDPIKSWELFLKKQKQKQDKLNELKITKLYYKNKLGTNLTITLPEGAMWASSASGKWIVNMPSYEIFTSPDYHETEGVVYASLPLNYNGKEVKDFSITFKKGKAVKWEAKEGEDILTQIINSDKLASYLGEVALVDYDSPISKTNKVFKTTLLDENASCHLALGSGFLECLQDSDKLSKKELDERGINSSKNHVDFMIGTKDLTIEALTKDGKVVIMKDGNLVI